MPFSVSDFRDWVGILYEHPEWREELRRLVLTDEILELPVIVRELAQAQRELAEAQQRTELRVEELAQAQRELAEAQRRTELRVEELAEAQRRTELRVEELAIAQTQLGKAVGELQRAFGSTVEEEAASVVEVVLRRKGYRATQPPYSLALNGEIDVVLPLEDPAGRQVWAVVEAKARLSRRDVLAWAQRMRSAEWHRRLAEKGCAGPYLVYAYSIRTDLGAQELAEAEGIGLLRSEGEVLPPKGLIEPARLE
ncbi:MAG: ATG16 family protein [Anaerolineales bacterium]|nr:ATG16 family protein [Anaerolineales bacterium]